ncbi:MAG: hypothetical protein L6V93_14855 [Clostridiales bacterium]|nr:MAG: hypothetical protein L6V93_14855 [Clostridiales bacterium]
MPMRLKVTAKNFDNGEIGEISIKIQGFYQTDFVGGVGGKSETDKSLCVEKDPKRENSREAVFTPKCRFRFTKIF